MELIHQYFPDLTKDQYTAFEQLGDIYTTWNAQVNLISRKDMDHFYERHVLHSLGIAKFLSFEAGSTILDVGTGGGFPGIPLAILFPESKFTLVDSVGKKIKVVDDVSEQLSLKNVTAIHSRAEDLSGQYQYITSRAVTNMPKFVGWTKKLLVKEKGKILSNGIWYLKGGDLSEELLGFKKARVYSLSEVFTEEFFETKKLVFLPSGKR